MKPWHSLLIYYLKYRPGVLTFVSISIVCILTITLVSNFPCATRLFWGDKKLRIKFRSPRAKIFGVLPFFRRPLEGLRKRTYFRALHFTLRFLFPSVLYKHCILGLYCVFLKTSKLKSDTPPAGMFICMDNAEMGSRKHSFGILFAATNKNPKIIK